MLNPRVASRYAKSLLDLAVEKGQLEPVYSDMLYLQQVTRQSREFLALLRSPVVKADIKVKAINAVTSGKVSALTTSFIQLMAGKTREAVLPEIITSFVQQYKDSKGIKTVKLTTAVPVSDTVKAEIIAQVKKSAGYDNIELEESIDAAIIGGFVLQVGDKLIDASIAYDLKNIARQFENNDFIYKVR
ncbi:MAG TPA: ATP synthase F1 subunit delta [Flavisolibacter sp.]|jgi:F-type H+-transporting ATPase subunit delta|nr:ATP synthase F1 subunit delta [Flavisolibacter sp.]